MARGGADLARPGRMTHPGSRRRLSGRSKAMASHGAKRIAQRTRRRPVPSITRAAILDIARRRFAEAGFGATSMRAIAG